MPDALNHQHHHSHNRTDENIHTQSHTQPLADCDPVAPQPHAVARLRSARLARSSKPFLARGGPRNLRCAGCRLIPSHCLCGIDPALPVRAGVCLVMADIEALKPSNTGWLVADMVPRTFAFGWTRTEVDPALLALLADPQWQPYLVFPAGAVAPGRVVRDTLLPADTDTGKQPLFVLLDATWPEARKMFRKSPYLDRLPVLSLPADQPSRYGLRRSLREGNLCTSEVAARCLALAGESQAAHILEAYQDLFTHHYLQAKHQLPVQQRGSAYLHWHALRAASAPSGGNGCPASPRADAAVENAID